MSLITLPMSLDTAKVLEELLTDVSRFYKNSSGLYYSDYNDVQLLPEEVESLNELNRELKFHIFLTDNKDE